MEPRRRDEDPEVTIYLIRDEQPYFSRLYCLYCGLWIGQVKARVLKLEDSPAPSIELGIATGTRCKRCRQNYRIVATLNQEA